MGISSLLLNIFGPLTVISFFCIVFYFRSEKEYTLTQMQLNPLWLNLVGEYKKYTKKKNGRIGFFYYLFLVSITISIISILIELIIIIKTDFGFS